MLYVNRRRTLQPAIGEDPVSTFPDELDGIFRDHHALVFRTAYRITGNATDAEDVLQTVFLRLLRRDRAAGDLDHPESYLRRAALNVALDLVRARQRSKNVPLQDFDSVLVERTSFAPDHDQNTGELRACLRQALARLNPRAAEIFALRYFEDWSNTQIARTLGISQIHTAVSLHRARVQLQKEVRLFLGGKT